MEEISNYKKKFIQSLGIDMENIPSELLKMNEDMNKILTDEEVNFLERESLTGTYTKQFKLKNLIGTTHRDYYNKTWLESFITTKRGDDAVLKYFKNPNYYDQELKQFEQSDLNHDTPIELYESEGKFFIKGGNNRLSLIMVKYLTEMSNAKTEEEKKIIDDKYTFVAQVNPIPEDKEIMYMINMLRGRFGTNIRIRRNADNEKDCKYEIKMNESEEVININNKDELAEYVQTLYQLKNLGNKDDFQRRVMNIIQDEIMYKECKENDKVRIINNFIPRYNEFKEIYLNIRRQGLEERLFEEIDFGNVDFDEIIEKSNIILDEIKNENKIQQNEEKNEDIEEFKNEEVEKNNNSIESENKEEIEKDESELKIDWKKIASIENINENIEQNDFEISEYEKLIKSLNKDKNIEEIKSENNEKISEIKEFQNEKNEDVDIELNKADNNIKNDTFNIENNSFEINEFGEILRSSNVESENLVNEVNNSNKKISLMPKLVKIISTNKFLSKLPFIKKITEKQLKMLPEGKGDKSYIEDNNKFINDLKSLKFDEIDINYEYNEIQEDKKIIESKENFEI